MLLVFSGSTGMLVCGITLAFAGGAQMNCARSALPKLRPTAANIVRPCRRHLSLLSLEATPDPARQQSGSIDETRGYGDHCDKPRHCFTRVSILFAPDVSDIARLCCSGIFVHGSVYVQRRAWAVVSWGRGEFRAWWHRNNHSALRISKAHGDVGLVTE